MQKLALYIIKEIIDHPEDLKVESNKNDGLLTLVVKLNPLDMGKVIGKGGRTINAIRSLIKILAAKTQERCNINIETLNQETV
ncbi:KH domain-containing protein [Candidatus Collierbacteria bacterium]|nr:KH domain-containing protein [Candidatus Collierbacteria bacterium]